MQSVLYQVDTNSKQAEKMAKTTIILEETVLCVNKYCSILYIRTGRRNNYYVFCAMY